MGGSFGVFKSDFIIKIDSISPVAGISCHAHFGSNEAAGGGGKLRPQDGERLSQYI